MQAFQLDSILLSVDTIIISEDLDIKCFSYRKVKTRHVYLWRGLTRCFCFKGFLNFNNQFGCIYDALVFQTDSGVILL